jgi:hypothetical protein
VTVAFKKSARRSSASPNVHGEAALRARIAKLEQALAKKRNVRGKSGDVARGGWCTPKPLAEAVGRWELDPFSNERSNIDCDAECILELGDDGFGREREKRAGEGWYYRAATGFGRAYPDTRVWLQPDYSFVQRAIDHYGHTRFCALLRFDPRTDWFRRLYVRCQLVCVLWDINFEPPPGVEASTNTFPHALFYRRFEDATPAALRRGIAWRTGHGT